MRKLLGVALFAVACGGDPRIPFVGVYVGTGTRTVSFSDGSTDVSVFDADFTIAAPAKSDRLQIDVSCMFTAQPLDAETIQLDAVTCPTKRSTTVSGAMADFTADYEVGVGKLANKTLTITQQGVNIGTNYSDGSPTQRYPFLVKLSVTKQ